MPDENPENQIGIVVYLKRKKGKSKNEADN
jgi:hypothetical protein